MIGSNKHGLTELEAFEDRFLKHAAKLHELAASPLTCARARRQIAATLAEMHAIFAALDRVSRIDATLTIGYIGAPDDREPVSPCRSRSRPRMVPA